jgi:hypothetical protein
VADITTMVPRLWRLLASWRDHRPTREELEEAANAVPRLLEEIERLRKVEAAARKLTNNRLLDGLPEQRCDCERCRDVGALRAALKEGT